MPREGFLLEFAGFIPDAQFNVSRNYRDNQKTNLKFRKLISLVQKVNYKNWFCRCRDSVPHSLNLLHGTQIIFIIKTNRVIEGCFCFGGKNIMLLKIPITQGTQTNIQEISPDRYTWKKNHPTVIYIWEISLGPFLLKSLLSSSSPVFFFLSFFLLCCLYGSLPQV